MEEKNIALLIDAENVSAKYAKSIFDELTSFGTVSVRRIYGNWQKHNGWDEVLLLEYSIQPIQQFDYTKGKNATDMAMVIDAMDILYSKNTDIFCIVTSDSDFTKLVMRLRESQAYIIGMGESKTPTALTKSCNKFIHLDLISPEEPKAEEQKSSAAGRRKVPETQESNVTPINLIRDAVIELTADSDSVSLSEVGSSLARMFTDFDVRNYGYSKLSVFIREEFNKIQLQEKGGSYIIKMKNSVDIEVICREIREIIARNGGSVGNLSKIYEILKLNHKDFNLKDYGFSRFSSFLRSIEGITVEENKVKLNP